MNSVTRMSVEGEVVIPREVRERLHLEAGVEFEIIEAPDRVVLQRRQPAAPRDTITHRAFVAGLPKYDGAPLSLEDMDEAIAAGRTARVRKTIGS